jgi:hypothetical protein
MKSPDAGKSENAIVLITQMDSALYRDFRNASTRAIAFEHAALFEIAFAKGRDALKKVIHEYVQIVRLGTPHALVEVFEQMDTEVKARRFALFYVAEALKIDNPQQWEVYTRELCMILKVSEKMTAELITRLTEMK